jgi:hypothetical protein
MGPSLLRYYAVANSQAAYQSRKRYSFWQRRTIAQGIYPTDETTRIKKRTPLRQFSVALADLVLVARQRYRE